MEKSVSLRGHEVTFSIWDIGGHKDFESMLPLVCNDAAVSLGFVVVVVVLLFLSL
jgi:GTP-binding protein of the ras superfamily involved in termination of M-phase